MRNPGEEKSVHHLYSPAPGVAYISGYYGITLIHPEKKEIFLLRYPGAVVWELACRDYGTGRIIFCLKTIARITESHAALIVKETFLQLFGRGFVSRKEIHG